MIIALYVRVSTEEQKINGLSVETQKALLKKWADDNGHIIYDYYVDAGLTARKRLNHRKELLRLLEDVKQGKIDMIVFTKLDRWFRNISDYYKVQEILDKYKVNWRTILEDYDTSTASGRLHINIMLSVAQDEADRTSERIKTVFSNQINNGNYVNGSVPFGYDLVDKRLVINKEKAKIVQYVYDTYELKQSIMGTQREFCKTHWKCSYDFISDMIRKELYVGKYRGNENFCEGIISKEQFERVQNITRIPFSRNASISERTYIFGGIIKCAVCDRTMSSYLSHNPKPVKAYRCRHGVSHTTCTHNKIIRECILEQKVIDEITSYITKAFDDLTVKTIKRDKNNVKNEITSLRRKRERLKELYINEVIEIEEYKKDYEKLNARISELENKSEELENRMELKGIVKFLKESSFDEIYSKLDDEHKRLFWRNVLDAVYVDNDNEVRIVLRKQV